MRSSDGGRRWPIVAAAGAALAVVAPGAFLFNQSPRDADAGQPAVEVSAQAAALTEERQAEVYAALLRHHLSRDIPVADDWNGVLYLPSTTRKDAADPMSDPFEPGDDPIPAAVRQRLERELMDVADVRWVDDADEAGLESLDANKRCDALPSAVLVWLSPVADGPTVEVDFSSYGNCGIATGGTYVVQSSDGGWSTSSRLAWIT